MRQSLITSKRFFPILLCLVFFLHIGSLIVKLNSDDRQTSQERDNPPLKIKIQNDPFKNKRQIVQSEDSEIRKVLDGSFLSDKNRSFDFERRARKNDIFSKRESGQSVKLSDLGSHVGSNPFEKAAKDYVKNKKDSTVSSSNDYLKDIPLGDLTNLNTTEYKFYGFYHRIRQKLEQFWGASLEEKAQELVKSGRRVLASEEMITALRITLDAQGEITAIKVLGTSGMKELDDAAIESFNQAGPFPNPPKGLIVDGQVTLEWGFVVKS